MRRDMSSTRMDVDWAHIAQCAVIWWFMSDTIVCEQIVAWSVGRTAAFECYYVYMASVRACCHVSCDLHLVARCLGMLWHIKISHSTENDAGQHNDDSPYSRSRKDGIVSHPRHCAKRLSYTIRTRFQTNCAKARWRALTLERFVWLCKKTNKRTLSQLRIASTTKQHPTICVLILRTRIVSTTRENSDDHLTGATTSTHLDDDKKYRGP